MSKYTTELRYICEQQAERTSSGEYSDIASIIEAARVKIFDFQYPYYNAEQKARTETNILRHFYTMEIGEETYGLWKLRLNDRMNLIMPYYAKLFESADLEFNPLNDIDLTEQLDEVTTGHNEGNVKGNTSGSQNDTSSNNTVTADTTESASHNSERNVSTAESNSNSATASNGKDTSKYSDTPQGSIQNLENDSYLTNARLDDSSDSSASSDNTASSSEDNRTGNNSTASKRDLTTDNTGSVNRITAGTNSQDSEDNANGTRDYLKTMKGKTAGKTYSEMLQQYRNTLLNIDMMICNDLKDLFMLLW